MGTHIVDNKLVMSTEPKSFRFDLPKIADNKFNQEIYSIIKHNKSLSEQTIKNEVRQLLSKYKYENNIHEHRKQQNVWTTQICS